MFTVVSESNVDTAISAHNNRAHRTLKYPSVGRWLSQLACLCSEIYDIYVLIVTAVAFHLLLHPHCIPLRHPIRTEGQQVVE